MTQGRKLWWDVRAAPPCGAGSNGRGARQHMFLSSAVNWIAFAAIVVIYWTVPPRARVAWLAASSFALLAFNDFAAAAVLVAVGTVALVAPRWVRAGGAASGVRLWTAAIVLLLPLAIFKYVAPAIPRGPMTLLDSLALPIGISYFTIKSLMYVVDTSRGAVERPGLAGFVAFLALAPTFTAGPIDAPGRLLPQFESGCRLSADDVAYALLRITTGAFLKFVLADALLRVIGDYKPELLAVSGSRLLLFGPLYALMIYFDFAGYSHMAIGAAALLGIRSSENFAAPYLKPNIAEFWRSWHMSLTGFLRRYIFLPLAYRWSRLVSPEAASYGATIVTFVLCGVWHGSGWNFVLWGGYHGALLSGHQAYLRATKNRRAFQRVRRARWFVPLSTATTFAFVCAGWYFFAFDMGQLRVIARGWWP